MSTAWLEPWRTQAKLWLRHLQGRSLTQHEAGWGGVGGGRHLCVLENNPLLGNKEVDATGLVAPSLLHFGALGPENIRPAEEQVGSSGGQVLGLCCLQSEAVSEPVGLDSPPICEAFHPWPCCLGATFYIM